MALYVDPKLRYAKMTGVSPRRHLLYVEYKDSVSGAHRSARPHDQCWVDLVDWCHANIGHEIKDGRSIWIVAKSPLTQYVSFHNEEDALACLLGFDFPNSKTIETHF